MAGHQVGAEQTRLWETTIAKAQGMVGPDAVNRWLKRTLLVSQQDGVATIAAPYEYPVRALADSALEACQDVLSQELGRAVTLQLEVIPYPDSE